jgi:hypothetical protein
MIISHTYAVTLNDELVVLHNVTTAQMNAINSPFEGSLVFNTDDKRIYERNATAWHKISSDGSETKIVAGACMQVTGNGTSANPYMVSRFYKGEVQSNPGVTCKEILDTTPSGCVVRDGKYWIDPDGGSSANAFEVYCDMSGGGWTEVPYASDLEKEKHLPTGADRWRWLPNNFSLALTDTQINAIRVHSTEAKQTYVGHCNGVLLYYYNGRNNYNWAAAFRFHNGQETPRGQQNYTGTNIVVAQDGCRTNTNTSKDTIFNINDIRLPIINIETNDQGGSSEIFWSPLTDNPAWFR